MTARVEFSHLPDVTFVEHDTEKVQADIIALYEGITKQTLYPGSPVRLFLSTLAAALTQRKVETDFTGKMNLLRYAKGKYLDQLGAWLNVFRLATTFAAATVRFSIAAPIDFAVMIPQGTRVTADSRLHFGTEALAWIPAGGTYVDIPVRAMVAGAAANGLVPGQVNRLVDPLAVVVTVANVTPTAGGADIEEDEALRLRIHLAPEAFTTAGSKLAYAFWTRSAHPGIADVAVSSPTPGRVKIHILLAGGVIPNSDGPEIRAAREIVSGEKVRPLTDNVDVLPAVAAPLDYQFRYFLSRSQAGYAENVSANIRAAAAEYERWQIAVIGRDINPDELIRACRAAGAKRIEPEVVTRADDGSVATRTPMTFSRLADDQVTQIVQAGERVFFGGIEDE